MSDFPFKAYVDTPAGERIFAAGVTLAKLIEILQQTNRAELEAFRQRQHPKNGRASSE